MKQMLYLNEQLQLEPVLVLGVFFNPKTDRTEACVFMKDNKCKNVNVARLQLDTNSYNRIFAN